MLYNIVSALILIALCVIVFTLCFWAGPCKACGSWWNWKEESLSYDNHQPHLVFINCFDRCGGCDNRLHRRQKTRPAYRDF